MKNFESQIKDVGLKATKQRCKIMSFLENTKKPCTIDELSTQFPEINYSSIFRSLQIFVKVGLVQSTKIGGGKKEFYSIKSVGGHNHHIVCNSCGKIDKVEFCLINEVQKSTDYKITNHIMEFKGICPECK